jgi:hypothetical protein
MSIISSSQSVVGNALSAHAKVCEHGWSSVTVSDSLGSNSFLCERDTARLLSILFLVFHQIVSPLSHKISNFSKLKTSRL